MLTTQAEAGTPGKSSFAEEAETDPPLGIKYFYQRNDPDSSAASIIKLDLMVRAERHVGATDNFRKKNNEAASKDAESKSCCFVGQ